MTNPTSMAGAMKQFVSKDRVLPVDLSTKPPLSAQEIAIRQACDQLAETLIQKNRDYGKGNIAEYGELGVLVRLSDKYNRLKNLITTGRPESCESIEDSWKDLAGYAIIGYLHRKGRW